MSLRKGSSELTAEASDPPGGPGSPASIRTSHTAWGSGVATCPGGTSSSANLLLEDSPAYRIQCWWLRRALPPQHAGQLWSGPLCIAYYQDTQCSRTRAEPVCRINWIRRHGTFPSCHLRRKLHDPLSYVAGDAASYTWHCFDKTAPGHTGRGTPGAGKDIRRKISFACDAIMYEQYDILYYNAGPTCWGPSSHVRASLEI